MTEDEEKIMHLHMIIDMMVSVGSIKIVEGKNSTGGRMIEYKLAWMGTWIRLGSVDLVEMNDLIDPNKPPPETPIN